MRPVPDALMLFAAGLGTRMGVLTSQRPKPLIEVGDKALIDHALTLADQAGIRHVTANLHYYPEQIRSHLSDRQNISFSDETDALLETGGGLRKALNLLGPGPVYTLNTDAVWTGTNALSELRSRWDPNTMSALLLLVPKARATGHSGCGDFDLDQSGRIRRGKDYVYTGAQIINPEGIENVSGRAFSLNVLWDRILADGRLFGCVHSGGWCDVGRPDSIPLAEALIAGAADV